MPANTIRTLVADLKGGDEFMYQGQMVEVFDATPSGLMTIVRYLDGTGEVKSVRVYAIQHVSRKAVA
jgi:hypothetical protein